MGLLMSASALHGSSSGHPRQTATNGSGSLSSAMNRSSPDHDGSASSIALLSAIQASVGDAISRSPRTTRRGGCTRGPR